MENVASNLCPTAKNRFFVVHTLIDAWKTICSLRNIESGWAQAGLYPFDYKPLAESKYIRQSQPDDIMHPPHRGIDINGMEITNPQKMFEIACHYYKTQLASIPVPNKEDIILGLDKDKESILTPPPLFYYFVSQTYLTIIYN